VKNISFIILLTAIVSAFTSIPARADFFNSVPGLPWLKEGTVITSKWYAARMPDSEVRMEVDANGNWIGSDGRNYSLITEQAMDAGGLHQLTVSCIDGDSVIVKDSTYYSMQLMGFPDPMFGGSADRKDLTQANLAWMSPNLLALEATDASHGKIVSQVKWKKADGTLANAVRIDRVSDGGATCQIYDRTSGLCLSLQSISRDYDKSTIFIKYVLQNVRTLNVPWSQEPIPAAVANLNAMSLAGRRVQEKRFGLGPVGVSLDYTLVQRNNRWLSFDIKGDMESPTMPNLPKYLQPKHAPTIFTSYDFSGLWIGPAAAAMLQPGQVLDQDPDTNTQTVVSAINGNIIEITRSNRSGTLTCAYDRATGLLAGIDTKETMVGMHYTLQRTGVK